MLRCKSHEKHPPGPYAGRGIVPEGAAEGMLGNGSAAAPMPSCGAQVVLLESWPGAMAALWAAPGAAGISPSMPGLPETQK